MGMMRTILAFLVLFNCSIQLVFLQNSLTAVAQLSKPVAHDDNMKDRVKNNKFLSREATDDANPAPELDEEALAGTQCPQNLELRWQAEVGSSIYSTPLISDINGDGKLEIVVPTFVHYLEVLDGADGEKLTGWPAQHQSTVHAGALVYDIDQDGNKEIALATFNGEVLFYRSGGYQLPDKLVVPRLKVRKAWYANLYPDHVDRSRPDVQDDSLLAQFNDTDSSGDLPSNSTQESTQKATQQVTQEANSTQEVANSTQEVTQEANSTTEMANSTQEVTQEVTQEANSTTEVANSTQEVTQEANGTQRRLLQTEGVDGAVGDSATKSKGEETTESVPTVEDPDNPMEEDALRSFDVFRDEDENGEDGLTEEYAYDYDDYVNEDMWGDEEWDRLPIHAQLHEFVEVDAHILSTPVIADIDKDGIDEMVIAVSYFYDHLYYQDKEHAKEVGEDVNLKKYVAGAIVVFNLDTKMMKWEQQLDLSSDDTIYQALIYSAPTVVDLDGDGYLDILVGTSMGFAYVLDHQGQARKEFPKLMAEIQSQIVAADINDDGRIEIVTTDSHGNVAAWTADGKELWEVHLKSRISQGPTVGDVDGDGRTDLVVPTSSGHIYVLRGSDGSHVGPYPFRTHGRVMSPALLVDLTGRGAERKGLTIAVGSFDGYFYLIDGPTGCAEAIDIGETTYSMALADNVDGGDDLDLVVTTMNGNVYCFQTPAAHHPLKAWPSQGQGRNVLASRHQREGIFVVPSSRAFTDQAGESFHVTFEIVDKHTIPTGAMGPYKVKVTLLTPGNYRGEKRVSFNYTYERPGVYTVTLPCLPTRTTGSVAVEMLDKNSLYFYDEFALTFHNHYYQLLKWLLTLPLLAMTCVFLLFPAQEEGISLPSFTRDRHQL